ncbi:MAG: hypothetical protein QOK48_2336 [Blastocatellia bacterium]|nr:hypothetical protein [Blastocatellia bacterium]
MQAGRKWLRRGGLAVLVAFMGVCMSALPGRVRTGGSVVRASENCVLQGRSGVVNGTPTCDCTVTGSQCGCIVPSPCPPGLD